MHWVKTVTTGISLLSHGVRSLSVFAKGSKDQRDYEGLLLPSNLGKHNWL